MVEVKVTFESDPVKTPWERGVEIALHHVKKWDNEGLNAETPTHRNICFIRAGVAMEIYDAINAEWLKDTVDEAIMEILSDPTPVKGGVAMSMTRRALEAQAETIAQLKERVAKLEREADGLLSLI